MCVKAYFLKKAPRLSSEVLNAVCFMPSLGTSRPLWT